MSENFGAQCTVVAIDARQTEPGKWEVVTRSGTQAEPLSAVDWSVEVERLGAGEILLTSFDRDGTQRL